MAAGTSGSMRAQRFSRVCERGGYSVPRLGMPQGSTLLDQGVPIIRRTASAKEATENAVGIITPARLAQRVFVVDPGINDDAGFRAVAKEQSKSAQKLCAPPMTMSRAQRVAQRELISRRVAGDFGRDQIDDSLQQLRFWMLRVAHRIRRAEPPHFGDQRVECLTESRVDVNLPVSAPRSFFGHSVTSSGMTSSSRTLTDRVRSRASSIRVAESGLI